MLLVVTVDMLQRQFGSVYQVFELIAKEEPHGQEPRFRALARFIVPRQFHRHRTDLTDQIRFRRDSAREPLSGSVLTVEVDLLVDTIQQNAQVGHIEVEDKPTSGIQMLEDTVQRLELVVRLNEMREHAKRRDDKIEFLVEMKRPCVLVKNAVVVFAAELVPELLEHGLAQVDTVDISAAVKGVDEKPSGSDTDFQNRAFGREYCAKKIVVIDGAQVSIDGIVKPGEIFRISNVRLHDFFAHFHLMVQPME